MMTTPVSTVEKLKAAERELAMRRAAYPKWVGSGRMTHDKATREIDIMAAIVEDYRARLWDEADPNARSGT